MSWRSPSLLAGFPGTEGQGERDCAGMYREGMSQVKGNPSGWRGEKTNGKSTGEQKKRPAERTCRIQGGKNMEGQRGKIVFKKQRGESCLSYRTKIPNIATTLASP